MKNFTIRVFTVSLFRKDGSFIDSTQVDEENEQLAKDLLYTEFGNDSLEGDYFEFEPTTERISEIQYIKAELKNEILEKE